MIRRCLHIIIASTRPWEGLHQGLLEVLQGVRRNYIIYTEQSKFWYYNTLFRFGTNGQEEITCGFIEKADGNFTPISSDDSNTEQEIIGVATQ